MKILLVEDDARLVSVLERAIRETGWTIETARDGVEGDHLLKTGGGDAVVLDLGLPGRSGLELLKRLRARGSTLPVLERARDALRLDALEHHARREEDRREEGRREAGDARAERHGSSSPRSSA